MSFVYFKNDVFYTYQMSGDANRNRSKLINKHFFNCLTDFTIQFIEFINYFNIMTK